MGWLLDWGIVLQGVALYCNIGSAVGWNCIAIRGYWKCIAIGRKLYCKRRLKGLRIVLQYN